MSTEDEIRKVRVQKLENIKKSGIWPYPISTKRTHEISAVFCDWDKLVADATQVVLVGRMRSMRGHGGLTFVDIEDGTGRIQTLLRQDGLGPKSYKFFADNFDIGDFIEARGTLFVTKRGEKTLDVADYKILSKSLLPLPEKWHGLQDVEERYRKRYLDLIFNDDVRQKFVIRAAIINAIREFLERHGFIEVETPILQTLYGGATARPFKTHSAAFDVDLYLRIAPELFLKSLIVGGFEKVYEIGKCFRNEGVDKQHNPDFTMLEFYWAYADYKQLMKLTEELLSNVLEKVLGKTKINYQGKEIDFVAPWLRLEYTELIKKYAKVDYWSLNRDGLAKEAQKMGVEIKPGAGKAEIADEIFKKFCRQNIIQPTFVIHYPAECKPLAKQLEDDSPVVANFQLIVNGYEITNAYSEQNDPLQQSMRLKEQEEMFKKGFEEAQRSDKNFVEALEYGMPPTAGIGIGIDRLVALLTDSNSLREIILFPIMKPRTEPKSVDSSSRRSAKIDGMVSEN